MYRMRDRGRSMSAAYSGGFRIRNKNEKITLQPGEEDWDEARERIMLYLRALNIPARTGLEIALEALNIAQGENKGRDKHPPVSLAMKALKRTLVSYGFFSAEGLIHGKWIRNGSGGQGFVNDPDLTEQRCMPSINRGSMKPEKLE
jgi:hypothetical protein